MTACSRWAQRGSAKTRAGALVLAALAYLGLLAVATVAGMSDAATATPARALPAASRDAAAGGHLGHAGREGSLRGRASDATLESVVPAENARLATEEGDADGNAWAGGIVGTARLAGIPGAASAIGLVWVHWRRLRARKTRIAWGRARAPDPARGAAWRPEADPWAGATAVWG